MLAPTLWHMGEAKEVALRHPRNSLRRVLT